MRSVSSDIVKATAGAVDVVRPARSGLVVLIYHRVGGHTPVRVEYRPVSRALRDGEQVGST